MQNVETPYQKENIAYAFLSVELAAAVICMFLFFQTVPRYDTLTSDGSDNVASIGPDIVDQSMELPPGLLLADGKIEEASAAATALLHNKRIDVKANVCAGNVFMAIGSKPDGLKYLKNAVALSRRNRYVLENYAEKLAEAGLTEEAISQFQMLTTSYPEWQKPHLELAKLYMAFDQPAEAAEQFKKVLEVNDKNFAVRKLRAICLARSSQVKQGLDEYVLATTQEAQSGIPQAIRSVVGNAGLKAVDRVTYELNQLVNNKPDEYVPKLRLAQLYQYQNQLQQAEELLLDARRLAPNNLEIHRTLAVVQKQLGEENQALSEFALSVKLETAQDKERRSN